MALPIWQDYTVTLDTGVDSASYLIRETATGSTIFSGKAYTRPGATDPVARINDICADWLHNTFPVEAAALSPADFAALSLPVTFEVEVGGAVVDTVAFYDDWSYDPGFDYTTQGLSAPINGRIDCRQWIPCTVLEAPEVSALITFTDGTTTTVLIPLEVQADFNIDYNEDFAVAVHLSGSGTAVFDLSQWMDVASVQLNGLTTYRVVTCCGEYALLYRNAYGGWDTFLMAGSAECATTSTSCGRAGPSTPASSPTTRPAGCTTSSTPPTSTSRTLPAALSSRWSSPTPRRSTSASPTVAAWPSTPSPQSSRRSA